MIRRKVYDYGDIFGDIMSDFAVEWNWFSPFTDSTPFRGQIVDPERYDIVPKESYRQELLKRKQEEIELLDRNYQERRKRLEEEKDSLKALESKNKDS